MDATTFLEGVYRHHGGLVDRNGEVLTLLAPPSSGLAESADVWTGAPEACPPEAELLHPGHPVLEAAMQRALQEGQVGLRHLVTGPTRRSGLDELARRTFGFRNARLQVREGHPATIPWVTFHFHVTFLWDEKREDLVSVAVDLQNGTRPPLERLARAWLDPGGLPGADRTGLERGLAMARRHLEQQLAPRLKSLQEQVTRHAGTEEERLSSYYGRLVQDLDKRLRSAAPSRVAGLQAKRSQAEAEWTARRAENLEKYRLRVRARLSCLEMIDLPRILLPATLTAGKAQRELVLSYSLLTHDFDPLACESCLGATRVVWLCDSGHLVCPTCYPSCPACGRASCHACPGGTCSTCGARRCNHCDKCACTMKRSGEHQAAGQGSAHARPGNGRSAASAVGSEGNGGAPPASAAGNEKSPSASPLALLHGRTLVGELFADLLPWFQDLAQRLEPILELVDAQKYKPAASLVDDFEWKVPEEPEKHKVLKERLQRVASCLRSSSPAEVHARLRKLHTHLPKVAPPRARPTEIQPRANQAIQAVRKRLSEMKAPPEYVEQVVQLLELKAGVIAQSSSDPAGFAAAACYLVSSNTQAQAGRWFGVSASVVSQRCRDMRLTRG